MKKSVSYLLLAACLFIITVSCGEKVPPLNERIQKVWQPRLVLQDGTTVFQQGASNNIVPAYSTYRLDLSSPPSVRLTEIDGNVFVGTYALTNEDTKIVLSGLSPEPTGTGGTISFTIRSSTEAELELVADDISAKTGNTVNTFTLVTN